MAVLDLPFVAPGPVAQAFMTSRNRIDCLMGPIGSAKTSTNFFRHVFTALDQVPHPGTGIRRYSFGTIRNTYRDLERTTIPSWLRWFPKEVGNFTGGTGGAPARHDLKFRLADASTVSLTAHFIGLGDQTIEQATRGMEVTGYYLNEADLLTRDALQHCNSRVGRDPAVDAHAGFAGATWRGVTADCNAPDTENWIYQDFIDDPKEGYGFFRQPSGLSPDAENLANLVGGQGYYTELVKGQDDWWVRRFVRNEFGYSREGKPVYPEWNDALHVAPTPLAPIPGRPIAIGFDAGFNPAAIWLQEAADGQIRVLEEFAPDNMGAHDFGTEVDRINARRYGDYDIEGWPDPSAFNRAAEATDEASWVAIVKAKTKIKMHRLPTNAIMPRIEAVRQPLTRMIGGRTPGFLLSPACRLLRKGFNSGYRYRRIKTSADRYAEVPEKNAFSHPHDGLQYGVLGITGYAALTGRKTRDAAQRQALIKAATGGKPFNPLDW